MKVEAYLKRIGYDGPLEPGAGTLGRLHKAHLLSVPFENLDIHLGRPIVLDENRIINKIVAEGRGGFCYELNGAFCALLRALGFEVAMLSAGVARAGGGFDPPFDHMALLVQLEEPWLADVGFGDCFLEPLRLNERGEQPRGDGVYRLIEEAAHIVLQRREQDSWKPQYRFTLQPYHLADFNDMCRYHQTSPESPFTQRRTCSRATAEGRITVTGMRLIETARGHKTERALADDTQWRAALREHFGIELGYPPLGS